MAEMDLTKLEVSWSTRALAPGEVATQSDLRKKLDGLRRLQDAPATEMALAPLRDCLCAASLGAAEADHVAAGESELQKLGLHELAHVEGEQGAGQLKAAALPSDALTRVTKARIKHEKIPVPAWLGRMLQAADVIREFGEPDSGALGRMNVLALNERVDGLTAVRAELEDVSRWRVLYEYAPVDQAMSNAALNKAGELLIATRDEFEKAMSDRRSPRQWIAPEVPDRILRGLQIANPKLVDEMRSRSPSVQATPSNGVGVCPARKLEISEAVLRLWLSGIQSAATPVA